MTARHGHRSQRVNWNRPEDEARNSRIPYGIVHVQNAIRRDDYEFYREMKHGPRDEAKSRELGRNAYRAPGYRPMADIVGCSPRTAFNRRARIVAARLCTLIERTDERGIVVGSWLIDNDFRDVLDDWRSDPGIAKTKDKGRPIVRNYRFIGMDEALKCQIAAVAVVPTRGAKLAPAAATPQGSPDVSRISAVLLKWAVPDDGKGALALLADARLQVADIAPAELAEALDLELDKRARWKLKKRERLEVNVAYIQTFIRGVAGVWAAGREDRRKDAERAAEAATRQAREQAELELRGEYEVFSSEALDAFVSALPEAEYAALLADATAALKPKHPMMTPAQLGALARAQVRHDCRERAAIPSYYAWLRRRDGSDVRARAAG